jgi:hypothetical protein
VFDRVLADAERRTAQEAPYQMLASIRRRALSLAHKPDIPGLPRYPKQAVDQQFARWVMLHVQSQPTADLHPAAGADQGQSAPDDGVPGRGGRDVRSVRNRRQLHPSGWRAGPGAGDRQTSDTIVGFGDTRIHAETATFELRASEFANPRPSDQLTVDGQNFVVQGEPERRDPDRLVWTLDVRLP